MPDPEVPGNGPNGRVVVAGGPAPFGVPAIFGVSANTDVATYSVPIDIPPGVAGMQPKISLDYNSGAGNGQLGVGWSIGGLSQIVRCPQTIATNGYAGGINDDGNDRFCLDGQQLIAVPAQGQSSAGAYGASGTNYAKEIDDFSEIISYGNTNSGGSFSSPSYFEVHTKSGLTLEFGNTAVSSNSQLLSASGNVVEQWALDKVTDQQSNYMTVNYYSVQGTLYPEAIYYANNATAGTSTTDSIDFVYQSRTDAPVLYAAGTSHQISDRLQDIAIYSNPNTLVSEYWLNYQYGPSTGRSELTGITKYDGSSPQNSLPALTFTYSNAQIDTQPDLITSIANGFGASTNITYLPATSPGVDLVGWNTAGDVWPTASTAPTSSIVRTVQNVIPVASYSGTILANVNQTYSSSYYCYGPETNEAGRGNLGFQDSTATDLQTGLTYVELFNETFPYIGDPSYIIEETPSGTWEDAYQNGYKWAISAQGTTFPYMWASQETRNDIEPGASFSQPVATASPTLPTITRTYSYDSSGSNHGSWGNLDQEVDSTSDGYSSTTTTTYEPFSGINQTDWLPGLVATNSLITQGIGQSASSARTTNYNYSSTYPNEITSVVLQSGASSNLQSTQYYTYDAFGNVTQEETENSDLNGQYPVSSITYDSLGQFPVKVKNAYNQVETLAHDARFGTVTSLTDINNQTTTYTYDTFGRQTQKTNPDGSYQTNQYTYALSNSQYRAYTLTQSIEPGGAASFGPAVYKAYDALGRLVFDNVEIFNGTYSVLVNVYDANGNLAETTKLYPYGTAPTFTTNTYDELGRVLMTTNPDGSVDTTNYNGQTIIAKNGLGQTATVFKDGHGNVSWSKDSLGNTMNFVYDGFDQRTKVTDAAGNVTTYNFDIRGRATSGTDPDKGTWYASYNSLGELTGTSDAAGNSSLIYYDLLGRMTQRVENGASGYASLTGSWTYDTAANGVGELASESASGAAAPAGGYTKTYSYDSYGRLSQTVVNEPQPWQPSQSGIYTETYGYDGASRPTTITTGWGDGFTTNYTPTGYRLGEQQTSTSNQLWAETSSDGANMITGASYGSAITQAFGYDAEERMTSILATSSAYGSPIESINYSYDALNNVLTKVTNALGSLATPYTEYYSYDGLNRLCTVNPSSAGLATIASASQPCQSQPSALTNVGVSVTYDSLGDLTSKLGDGGVGIYSYPAAGSARPHAVNSIANSAVNSNGGENSTFSYDPDGNLLSSTCTSNCTDDPSRTITYTAFGMPQTISQNGNTATFAYGPDHERVSQTETGTGAIDTLYLDNMNVTAAQGGTSPQVFSYFTDNNGQIVGEIDRTGVTTLSSNPTGSSGTAAVKLFLNDWQNSVSLITSATGVLIETDSYDAWGKRCQIAGCAPDVNDTITSQTIHGYTNQEHLANVQLIDLNARMYDPYLGNMLSVDPAVANWLDPQTWNAYAYARDNPLVYTDPNGMDAKACATSGACGGDSSADSGCDGDIDCSSSSGPLIFGSKPYQIPAIHIGYKATTSSSSSTGNDSSGLSTDDLTIGSGNGTGSISSRGLLVAVLLGTNSAAASDVYANPFADGAALATDAAVDSAILASAVEEMAAADGAGTVAAETAGTATILQYATDAGAHFSIEVNAGGQSLSTEQIITNEFNDTTIGINTSVNPVNSVTVQLPNGQGALDYMNGLLGENTGTYNSFSNSCLSYCGNVLNAGGLNVPLNSTLGTARFLNSLGP